MTDSLFRHVGARKISFSVESVDDREQLLEILSEDRLYAAYALAQLEPEAFRHAQWWTTAGADGLSLVCHSRAGLGDATFVAGPAAGVEAILSIHPGLYQTFATARPEHLPALESVYTMVNARVMQRMHLNAARFTPIDGETVRLRGEHTRALNRLYSSEGGATYYQPRHVEDGCYYGVVDGGRLVAVAGTHAVSRSHGIAVVGNVFTHPQHRGRGHATLATSAVTAALLEFCRDVVLSVNRDNDPAISAYHTLGYKDVGDIVEAAARRRIGGVTSGLRRMVASFRGRRRGVEIVRIDGK